MVGATGAVVSIVTASAAEAALGIGGRIARRRRQAVRAVRQRRRRIGPGAAAVGHRAAQQRRTVKDLDRCVGLRRTGQRQRVVIGDAVAHRAAVGRERGNGRRRRRHRVNRDAHRDRSRTGNARHRVGRGETMHPVRQGNRDKAPGPACIGRRRAEQRRPVVDIHRAVRHRGAGQRQDRRIGDAVADNARVRRERGNGRGSRRRRNCHRQGRRRHPGIAGRIGRRRRQAVRTIRQRRRRISSRRRCRWPPRCPTASHRQRP